MKMVELLVAYDMEKVFSGEVSIKSVDMITDIHVKSDDELTLSQRREFETEFSELIRKHFIVNRKDAEQDKLKRRYLISDLVWFMTNYITLGSKLEAYEYIARDDKNFLDAILDGRITTVSYSYILGVDGFNVNTLEKFEDMLSNIKREILINDQYISTDSVKYILTDVMGMTSDECHALFGKEYSSLITGILVSPTPGMVSLYTLDGMFKASNINRAFIIDMLVAHNKANSI